MPVLEPGASFDAGVTIRVHRGADELRDLERTVGGAAGIVGRK